MAWSMCSESSNIDRMMILQVWVVLAQRREGRKASPLGMRRFRITTSGRTRGTRVSISSPLTHRLCDDLDVGLDRVIPILTLFQAVESLDPIACLGNHDDVGIALQQPPEHSAKTRVVLGQEHTHQRVGPPCGRWTPRSVGLRVRKPAPPEMFPVA